MLKSTREAFGEALTELAAQKPDIVCLTADSARSMGLKRFLELFPDRFFDVGIAEQNLVNVAAGFALLNFVPFAATYSVFLAMRALEQVRTFVAYPQLNVKFGAGLGGLSGDTEGVTHQATEDVALIRAIPNLTLVSPADYYMARSAVAAAYAWEGPVYLRLGRGPSPTVYKEGAELRIGEPVILVDEGRDAVIFAVGRMVYEARTASEILRQKGILTTVVDLHTIKPLNAGFIKNLAAESSYAVTVEDGCVDGGLGSALAEVIAGRPPGSRPVQLLRIGLANTFGSSGKLEDLLEVYGLTAKAIAGRIEDHVTGRISV